MTETPYVSLGYDSFLLACTASAWEGDDKRCRWCDKPLTGRQQRWCSTSCADAASTQHWWSASSKAVRSLHTSCKRCGRSASDLPLSDRLEAHHVVAARGAHDRCSCLHHHENIEVLCTRCHVAEHRRRRELASWDRRVRRPSV